MNIKEAFRTGVEKFASEELGLDEEHTNRYVDLVEKEADELSVMLAAQGEEVMDKSAEIEDKSALEDYLCKRASQIADAAGGADELRKQAQDTPGFWTKIPKHVADAGRNELVRRGKDNLMNVQNSLSKGLKSIARKPGKGKLLAALAALAASAYGGSKLFGGEESEEPEAGLMEAMASNPGALAGAGAGGLGGERLANALSEGDALSRVLGGAGGAAAGGIAGDQLQDLIEG